MTHRPGLAVPPKVTAKQVVGFSLWGARSALDDDPAMAVDVARAHLRQLTVE